MTTIEKLNKILQNAWEMGIDIKGITLDESLKDEMNNAIRIDKSGFDYCKRNGFGSIEIKYSKQ